MINQAELSAVKGLAAVQNKTDFARAVLNTLGISGARSGAGGGMSMGRREGFVRIIAMVSKLGSFENFA